MRRSLISTLDDLMSRPAADQVEKMLAERLAKERSGFQAALPTGGGGRKPKPPEQPRIFKDLKRDAVDAARQEFGNF
jgi:hypothetical protein